MSRSKRMLMYIMAAFYAGVGYLHLASPGGFLAAMPPTLPEPELLNVIAGLAEIVLGVFLLEPRTRVLAAWGIIALLIAVFPVNVHMATENIGPDGPGSGGAVANWVRLPFQLLFIVWAWWYTRPDGENEGLL